MREASASPRTGSLGALPGRSLPPRPSLPGVRRALIRVDALELAVAVTGEGPPALLLHGYPQTHVMWRHVVARLAASHTLVLPDLRGYGESSRPPGGTGHAEYSKRAMAGDLLRLMQGLGYERFAVVGHDRGARVGHRLALDAPSAVESLAVLDILPTRHLLRDVGRPFADAYFHWFFLTQPELPERLIGQDVEGWVRWIIDRWSGNAQPIEPAAVAEYVRAMAQPGVVHASCEDYRAAATIDLEHDDVDAAAGRRVGAPLLAVWGADGAMGRLYDVAAAWTAYADDVSGVAVPGGHFVAEEAPEETIAALLAFLNDSRA